MHLNNISTAWWRHQNAQSRCSQNLCFGWISITCSFILPTTSLNLLSLFPSANVDDPEWAIPYPQRSARCHGAERQRQQVRHRGLASVKVCRRGGGDPPPSSPQELLRPALTRLKWSPPGGRDCAATPWCHWWEGCPARDSSAGFTFPLRVFGTSSHFFLRVFSCLCCDCSVQGRTSVTVFSPPFWLEAVKTLRTLFKRFFRFSEKTMYLLV